MSEPTWFHDYDRDVCEHGALMPNCPQGCLDDMLELRRELEDLADLRAMRTDPDYWTKKAAQ